MCRSGDACGCAEPTGSATAADACNPGWGMAAVWILGAISSCNITKQTTTPKSPPENHPRRIIPEKSQPKTISPNKSSPAKISPTTCQLKSTKHYPPVLGHGPVPGHHKLDRSLAKDLPAEIPEKLPPGPWPRTSRPGRPRVPEFLLISMVDTVFGSFPGPTRPRGGLGKASAGPPLDLHRFSAR